MIEDEIRDYGETEQPKRDNRGLVFFFAFVIVFGLLGAFLLTTNQNTDSGVEGSLSELDQALAANLKPLEDRLKENPQDVEAIVGIGRLYYQAGSFRESIKHFEHAEMTEPGNVDALLGLAMSFRAAGRQAEAEKALDSLRSVEASATDATLKARAAEAIAEIEKQPAP